MARPPGDVRMAVINAIRSAGPGTLREIGQRVNAERAKVKLSVVHYPALRSTVQNAVRGGDLQICGQAREPHAKCWVAIYDLAEAQDAPEQQPESALAEACAQLAAVVGVWGAAAPCRVTKTLQESFA